MSDTEIAEGPYRSWRSCTASDECTMVAMVGELDYGGILADDHA